MYTLNKSLAEKMVSQEHSDAQWERLNKIVIDTFAADPDRVEKLNKLYTDFEEQIRTAPASGKYHFHNSYVGGYLDHILHVVDCSLKIAGLYSKMNGHIDFTKSELVFSALHHDLGKVGDENGPYYVTQNSDWHREKQGELYKNNEDIAYMTVTDRAFYLLQKYQVVMTQNETISMRLADGLYEESNKKYLINWTPFAGKTNLGNIIHWGDMMASCIERDKAKADLT